MFLDPKIFFKINYLIFFFIFWRYLRHFSSSSSEEEDDEKVKNKYDLESVKNEKEPEEKKEDEKIDINDDEEKPKDKEEEKAEEEPAEINGIGDKKDENEIKENSEDKKENDDDDAEELKKDKEEVAVDEVVVVADKKESEKIDVEIEKNDTSSNSEVKIEEQSDDIVKETTAEAPQPVEEQPETIDLDKEKDVPTPRALHRTSSIFLRNLAPSITKAEIEAICQRFDGFLRVAIADPLVERRWYRRGWVTFKRDVNIKEYCWNLNNTRLRDCEMGAIVNRDLSRRVRPVNGMTAHKNIVRADIKLCAKIAMNMDEKFKLWVSLYFYLIYNNLSFKAEKIHNYFKFNFNWNYNHWQSSMFM